MVLVQSFAYVNDEEMLDTMPSFNAKSAVVENEQGREEDEDDDDDSDDSDDDDSDDDEEEEEEAGASLAFSRRLHTPSVRPEPVPAVSAAADSSTERTVRTTMSVVFLFSNLRLLFRRLSSSRQDCRYRQYSAVIEISSFFFL